MTRKGKLPIPVPSGVEVKISGSTVSVKGPKGLIEQDIRDGIIVKVEDNNIIVSPDAKTTNMRNFHGLYRTLIANMVHGTTQGFEKQLEMIGVGFRAAVQGNDLNLQVGLSHPTLIAIPAGIEVKIEKNTKIIITGIDKQQIGQFASTIRAIRPPEPYQGKGIRYVGEYVRRKAGKSAAKS
ncbi:MAG: 50S ribosomal protein L6 [Chlamydiae bacterium]|nr:50S ribosomal protein L6 [Chlamydiota bacterium]